MGSLGSYIRSAARATFSAYRSVPIRWRLAGGSALLTLVILAGFAGIVGVLTDRQVTKSFYTQLDGAIHALRVTTPTKQLDCDGRYLANFASADDAQIRVFDEDDNVVCTQEGVLGAKALAQLPQLLPPYKSGAFPEAGFQTEARPISLKSGPGWLLYARPLSSLDHTLAKVRVFLILGVLGGTVFALLAGLATAQRAIRPIVQLTAAAREIERTRDPSLRIPRIEADDEVAELARTLDGMLGALDAARAETEAALRRQREFVADASHELRTPLTSVLANLELLADELSGEQAESAKAALRSTRRMRRLVGDLLLLARADADRQLPHRPTNLGEILTDAAAELGPVADRHELTIDPEAAIVDGSGDELHRLMLNLLENAFRHTPPGTTIRARTGQVDGVPQLVVEDDGPGIPPELQRRVFERFVRGGGDTAGASRGTGLGLAIVRAVADSHGATLELGSLDDGTGTRFVLTFKGESTKAPDRPHTAGAGPDSRQTSTTTGSTIGRRRSRS